MKKAFKKFLIYVCIFVTMSVAFVAAITAFVVTQIGPTKTVVQSCHVDGTHCTTLAQTTKK